MGLLLGASVVTLFELIDMIVFNTIHKCINCCRRAGRAKPSKYYSDKHGPKDHSTSSKGHLSASDSLHSLSNGAITEAEKDKAEYGIPAASQSQYGMQTDYSGTQAYSNAGFT